MTHHEQAGLLADGRTPRTRSSRCPSRNLAAASTHELDLDALWGPAQDRVDLNWREFGFHANRMMRSPTGWHFVVVTVRRPLWRPGMVPGPYPTCDLKGRRPSGRWPGKERGRSRWRQVVPTRWRRAPGGRWLPETPRAQRARSLRPSRPRPHRRTGHLGCPCWRRIENSRPSSARSKRMRSSKPCADTGAARGSGRT